MRFRGKRGPVKSRDSVQSLAVVKGSKVERSVDEGIGVEDVEPEAEWFEFISDTVRWDFVIWSNEMERGAKV